MNIVFQFVMFQVRILSIVPLTKVQTLGEYICSNAVGWGVPFTSCILSQGSIPLCCWLCWPDMNCHRWWHQTSLSVGDCRNGFTAWTEWCWAHRPRGGSAKVEDMGLQSKLGSVCEHPVAEYAAPAQSVKFSNSSRVRSILISLQQLRLGLQQC